MMIFYLIFLLEIKRYLTFTTKDVTFELRNGILYQNTVYMNCKLNERHELTFFNDNENSYVPKSAPKIMSIYKVPKPTLQLSDQPSSEISKESLVESSGKEIDINDVRFIAEYSSDHILVPYDEKFESDIFNNPEITTAEIARYHGSIKPTTCLHSYFGYKTFYYGANTLFLTDHIQVKAIPYHDISHYTYGYIHIFVIQIIKYSNKVCYIELSDIKNDPLLFSTIQPLLNSHEIKLVKQYIKENYPAVKGKKTKSEKTLRSTIDFKTLKDPTHAEQKSLKDTIRIKTLKDTKEWRSLAETIGMKTFKDPTETTVKKDGKGEKEKTEINNKEVRDVRIKRNKSEASSRVKKISKMVSNKQIKDKKPNEEITHGWIKMKPSSESIAKKVSQRLLTSSNPRAITPTIEKAVPLLFFSEGDEDEYVKNFTPVDPPTLLAPVNSPVTNPFNSPINSQVNSPVNNPVISPVNSPVTSPITRARPYPVINRTRRRKSMDVNYSLRRMHSYNTKVRSEDFNKN
jgi:hypothetical protein